MSTNTSKTSSNPPSESTSRSRGSTPTPDPTVAKTTSSDQPIIAVPDHGWTLHVGPTGHLYAWNHLTQRATWKLPLVKPDPPFVAFPPPVPKYRVTVAPAEKVVAKHRLGDTSVWACDTDAGNRFFYHRTTKRSTWRATPDLTKWIKELDARLALEQKQLEEAAEELEPEMDEGMEVVQQAGAGGEGDDDEDEDEEMGDLEAELMMLEAQANPGHLPSFDHDDVTDPWGDAEVNNQDNQDDDDDEEEEIHEFTLAEKSAMFVAHLRSLDLSPFAPMDQVASLLPDIDLTPRQRQDLFDQYCQDRAAELKAAKLAGLDPRQQFLQLVYENRKLFWEEIKRKFKKDKRFYGYGTTDREREKLFKEAKKMKPDELKRAIDGSTASAGSAAGSSSTAPAASAQERKRAAAERALRAREAQVHADLANARQHATKVLRRANADEARALFGGLLVDYARAGDEPEAVMAAVRRDPRFHQVLQLGGLGMPVMLDLVHARLAEMRDAAVRLVRERLGKEVTLARVGGATAAGVLESSPWATEAAVVKSVGGPEALEDLVRQYLDDRKGEARKMAVDALADARASVEAWVADRLAEGLDPEQHVFGLAHVLRSDPRWAGVEGMPDQAEELMREAVSKAVVSLKQG